MAFYNNTSYVDETDNKKEVTETIQDGELMLLEDYNDVDRWDVNSMFVTYTSIRSKRVVPLKKENFLFGAENVLQLPKKFSQLDKMVFSQRRLVRRNAVHIYDNEKFKETFRTFLTLKNGMNL